MSGLPRGLVVEPVATPGLGDTSYVVTYEGAGILVDPQRDVERFLDRFERSGATLRYVLETHLHNDYVSGGPVAADETGATLVVPAAAAPAYRHLPAFHLEDIVDEAFTIRPVHTPGHTPEHTSYLLVVEGEPVAVFSGGSLLVGAAGRPDLLGGHRADSLARLQYRSVHRLAELGDGIRLYPTHGGGSFCAVTGASSGQSTLGAEKAGNPVLAYPSEDAFVEGQLSALQPYPSYYRHMGPANVVGGSPIPERGLPVLDVEHLDRGTVLVDMRDRRRQASGHLPGSLGVELRDDFGVWVGWMVDIDARIALVADPDQDVADAVTQLARIGYDGVVGVVPGPDESEAGLDRFRLVSLADAAELVERGMSVLDVRAPGEFADGHLEGSVGVYVPDLPAADLGGLSAGDEVLVACGTGYRATIAASVLERRGLRPVVLTGAGVPELMAVLAGRASVCEGPVSVGRAS